MVESVEKVVKAWAGQVPPEVTAAARIAAEAASDDIGGATRRLLEADIDDQRTTPLTLIRAAVRYPTAVLQAAGVPPVQRDRFAEERFPDDIYGLSPASFAEFSPDLAELGINWGAAKAFEHRRRRH